MWFKLFFVTLILFLASIGEAADTAVELPGYHGLTLARPTVLPSLEYAENLNYYAEDKYFGVVLKVDSKGRVKAVEARDSTDAEAIKSFEPYLKTMEFEPGVFRGKNKKQLIPLDLYVTIGRRVPDIKFPLNLKGEIENRDLYRLALVLNGMKLPRLAYFPSYNFHSNILPGVTEYPFALYKLDLDAKGRPTALALVKTTCANYTDQIQSAILWGRYEPLYIKGKAAPSVNYLLVSLLPQVNYPTNPLDFDSGKAIALRDKIRVRLLTDTLGLISAPLPENIIDGEFVCSSDTVRILGDVWYRVLVDTLGNVKLNRTQDKNSKFIKAGRGLTPHLRFFPAIDIQGRARPYEGDLNVTFTGSKRVYISIMWLQS